MNILFITDSLKAGGKERQLIELLKYITKEEGINVKLIILSESVDYDYVNNVIKDIHILKRRYKKDLSIYRELYKICKTFRPNIIHSWELMCSIYSLPIARAGGIKFINGIIRYAPAEFGVFTKKWLWVKLTFLFSDIVLSNSDAGLRSYRAPEGKSYRIHNGFDFGRLANIQNASEIKRKYNIFTEKVVGMVARFDKRKDYRSYITSSIDILERRNNVTFVTVGSGDTLNECINMVPPKYKKHIRFLGHQKDVESIINVFDIGILVSKEEGISNSIMEYMALKKPVVATMHGGNEEIVEDKRTGFLVKYRDVKDLTGKIEFLLENKDVAMDMGRAGRERLEKEFNTEKMTHEHLKLYKRVLDS